MFSAGELQQRRATLKARGAGANAKHAARDRQVEPEALTGSATSREVLASGRNYLSTSQQCKPRTGRDLPQDLSPAEEQRDVSHPTFARHRRLFESQAKSTAQSVVAAQFKGRSH